MKIICLLLSALASNAVAAKTAHDLYQEGLDLFVAGNLEGWAATFPEGCIIEINNPADYNFPYHGRYVNGKDGFSMIKMQELLGATYEYLGFQFEEYTQVKGDDTVLIEQSLTIRRKDTGEREHVTQISKIVAKDGKISSVSYTTLSVEKIDAASRVLAAYDIFKNGGTNPNGFNKFMGWVHKDFVMTTDIGPSELCGEWKGLEGFLEMSGKQAALLDFELDSDGNFQMDYKVLSKSPDGKTAVLELNYGYAYKEGGAKYFDQLHVIIKTDDFGQITHFEGLLNKSEPRNSAALFKEMMALVFTNPDGAKDLVTDDFYTRNEGKYLDVWDTLNVWGSAGADMRLADYVQMDYDKWVFLMKKQITVVTYTDMQMEILSEKDTQSIIRFKSVVTNKEGGSFRLVMDQTWNTNAAGSKLTSVIASTRSLEKIVAKKGL